MIKICLGVLMGVNFIYVNFYVLGISLIQLQVKIFNLMLVFVYGLIFYIQLKNLSFNWFILKRNVNLNQWMKRIV